jgi:hypothetical protein
MSLEAAYFISQIVAAFAIVGSLIFLGLEVRQSDKTQRALMHQARAQRGIELNLSMNEPHVLDLLEKVYSGRSDLAVRERIHLANLIRAFAHQAYDAEWQHKAHLLDAGALATATQPLVNLMAWPASRAIWKLAKRNYSEEMREMMDRLILSRPMRTSRQPRDQDAIWEAVVNTVMQQPSPPDNAPRDGQA